jgi:hypothetical protein
MTLVVASNLQVLTSIPHPVIIRLFFAGRARPRAILRSGRGEDPSSSIPVRTSQPNVQAATAPRRFLPHRIFGAGAGVGALGGGPRVLQASSYLPGSEGPRDDLSCLRRVFRSCIAYSIQWFLS